MTWLVNEGKKNKNKDKHCLEINLKSKQDAFIVALYAATRCSPAVLCDVNGNLQTFFCVYVEKVN